MRLLSFKIKGFKSIIDTGECALSEIDNIMVLAGQNEAGKSAVLEALDFFRNGPDKDFERLQVRLDSGTTEVTCKFAMEQADYASLGIDDPSSDLGKFFKKDPYLSFMRRHVHGKPTEEITLAVQTREQLQPFFPEPSSVDAEKAQVGPSANEPVVPSEVGPINEGVAESVAEVAPPPQPPEPKPSPFVEFSSKLVKLIPPFTIYTFFRDLLPSEVTAAELASSNAVKDFEKVFDVDLSLLLQITDPRERKIKRDEIAEKATDDFNKSWTQTISSLKDGESEYSFSIDTDSAKNSITFMISGREKTPLYLEQKSLGFRWFSAFHLRLRAMMKDDDDSEITHDNLGTRFVLLIDEPGQNLHDVAQRDVKSVIEETAGKHIQIIYSTHNPNLIGTEGDEFTRIRLVSNNEDTGTKVETVSQFISKVDGGSLDALSPIRTAMGLVSIGPIFDANKFNVVVEGITDHYYLSAFQKILSKDERIRFIPACGVDNVKHVVSVLIGWGCSYKAVLDDDPQQGRKAYNLMKKNFFEDDDNLAHEHIYKIKDKNGIEDVLLVTDFETYVLDRKKKDEEKTLKNSEIANNVGKEMLARLFLEKVEKGEAIALKDGTKQIVEAIFVWLYQKFGINSEPPNQGT